MAFFYVDLGQDCSSDADDLEFPISLLTSTEVRIGLAVGCTTSLR